MTADLEKLLAEATPGPWECGKGAGWFIKREGRRAALMVGMSAEYSIISDGQVTERGGSGPECEANARLMSLAPDLARQVIALTAENAALRAKAEKLAKAAEECAGDVEAFVNEAYCAPEIHPAMRAKYDRDMEIVSRTREEIAVFRAKETP